MADIILASASPGRKELMTTAGIDFSVKVADIAEKIPEGAKPYEAVMSLALQKAQAVAADNQDDIVIGADTIVVLDNEILGKPKDKNDAKRMLAELSGKAHSVYTGVAIIKGKKIKSFFDETRVEFYHLSEKEIDCYVETGEPMDKAGAYGIQGRGCLLVKKIDGDYFNVVGLPVSKLYRELSDFYD